MFVWLWYEVEDMREKASYNSKCLIIEITIIYGFTLPFRCNKPVVPATYYGSPVRLTYISSCLIPPAVKFYLSCWKQSHGPLARYVTFRIAHAPGMPGTFSRDRGLAIQTCIMVRASRTCRDAWRDHELAVCLKSVSGKTLPAFPAYAQPAILRIW